MRTWDPALWHPSRGVGRPDCLHLCLPVAWNMSYGGSLGAGSASSNQVPVLARMGSPVASAGAFRVAVNKHHGRFSLLFRFSASFHKKSCSRSQLHRLFKHGLWLSDMAE